MPYTVFPVIIGAPPVTSNGRIDVLDVVREAFNVRMVLLFMFKLKVPWVDTIPITAAAVVEPEFAELVDNLSTRLLLMFTTFDDPPCERIPVTPAVVPVLFNTCTLIMVSFCIERLPVEVVTIPWKRPLFSENIGSVLEPILLLLMVYTAEDPEHLN